MAVDELKMAALSFAHGSRLPLLKLLAVTAHELVVPLLLKHMPKPAVHA